MNDRSKDLIKTLVPELQDLARLMCLKGDMYLVSLRPSPNDFPWDGSTLEIVQAKRDIYLQSGLYTQGRHWNTFTMKWEIVDEEAIITRTLESKHLEGKAFDIAPCYNGKYLWEKFDVTNEFNRKVWLHLAEIGESLGLKAGARFTKPDYPHFEIA